MKKLLKDIKFVIIFVLLIVLSGCFLLPKSDGQHAEETLRQIVNGIESGDAKAIAALFSEQALEESPNIGEAANYIIDFFQGEILSWSSPSATIEGAWYTETYCISYNYVLVAEKNTYAMYFLKYIKNEDNPNTIGLYQLQIVLNVDRAEEVCWGANFGACIYVPDETAA